MHKQKSWVIYLVLFIVLAGACIVSLFAGAVRVPVSEMFESGIIRLRVARILLAIFAGAALSVSGVIFQALLRNPLEHGRFISERLSQRSSAFLHGQGRGLLCRRMKTDQWQLFLSMPGAKKPPSLVLLGEGPGYFTHLRHMVSSGPTIGNHRLLPVILFFNLYPSMQHFEW